MWSLQDARLDCPLLAACCLQHGEESLGRRLDLCRRNGKDFFEVLRASSLKAIPLLRAGSFGAGSRCRLLACLAN